MNCQNMANLKAIFSHGRTLFTIRNPSHFLKPLNSNHFLKPDLISSRFSPRLNLFPISLKPFSSSTEFVQIITSEVKKLETNKTKKPLDVFFKEAVGIIEKNDTMEEDLECGNGELKKILKKLEDEVRSIKEKRKIERSKNEDCKEGDSGKGAKRRSLVDLFSGEENKDGGSLRKKENLRMEDHRVHKELSPDMIMFVSHLYKEGYFKDSNFLPKHKFAIGCFENSYARDFVKFAAEQFGKDNQEIAKWLSASDLKKVALFGCPSLARKTVFSAKRLRTFFRIQENTVCDRCVLKKSCGFVNQSVWKGDTKSLNLAVIMRVITLYALESVPSELVVTEEIKSSVGKLLKEAVNLSGTVDKIS